MSTQSGYPNEKLAAVSYYSYEEICKTIDEWREVEKAFQAVIDSIPDFYAIPAEMQDEMHWFEDVEWNDEQWHRSGSAERYPVGKWKKIIRQHKKMMERLRPFASVKNEGETDDGTRIQAN